MPKETRSEIYKRQDVRRLLSWVINGHEEIKPSKEEKGYIYKPVCELLGVEDGKVILEELVSQNLFHRIVSCSLPSCPQCGSYTKLENKYKCPHCESAQMRKGSVIEHYECGYIDFSENFDRNSELICPKCRKTLKLVGVDYRRIASLYRCLRCKRDFSVPNYKHHCISCKVDFDYAEALLTQIYHYQFNKELRSEVISNCVIDVPIISFLEEIGYTVESLKNLKGNSGIEHTFDIVASKKDETIVFSIVSTVEEVGPDAIVNFFSKTFDVHPNRSILVALPKIASNAVKLSEIYHIEIIEGKGIDEILDSLKSKFKVGKSETTQISSTEESMKKLLQEVTPTIKTNPGISGTR